MRSVACLILIIGCFTLFFYGLHLYLKDIPNPFVMMFIMASSLLISLIYDFKQGLNRKSFTSGITTVIIYALTPYLSIECRIYYLEVVAALQDIPAQELEAQGFHHYVRAITNPMLGIGSCFGISLAALRLPMGNVLNKLIYKALYQQEVDYCSCCGKPL